MAKLYFKHGVVNSSKSANALMTIHNYEEQGMSVFLIKSKIDTRDGEFMKSRALNTSRKVDLFIDKDTNLFKIISDKSQSIDVIIVDECQFIEPVQVDQLRAIVDEFNIPVICYGLKTDYKTRLFESSKRLIEVADSLQEIKTVCRCGSKALFNGRFDSNGKLVTSGSSIKIGDIDIYKPLCSKCFNKSVNKY